MIELQDLQAKSDQMNAIDFVRPMVFRVAKVDYFPKQEQPILLHLEGCEGRPYKPCKSMLRGLSQVWGMDETQWQGKLIELYCDPSVKWAGKEYGGIRVSGVSGINKPHEFVVNLNRSQRKIHKLKALDDNQPVKAEFILTHHTDNISNAKTNNEIDAIVQDVKINFGKEALSQIKESVIEARKKLEAGE